MIAQSNFPIWSTLALGFVLGLRHALDADHLAAVGRIDEARQEIEAFLGTKVFLGLFVKVREHWREDESVLGEMGLAETGRSSEEA